jgi:hypothetical protein
MGVGGAEERIRLGDRARLWTRHHIANLRLDTSTARLAARRGRRTARRAVARRPRECVFNTLRCRIFTSCRL